MHHSPIIFWLRSRTHSAGSGSEHQHHVALQAQGFGVQYSHDIRCLYRLIDKCVTQTDVSIIVVLGGSQDDNCVVASYLRALHPGLGIVAMLESSTERAMIELLRSGVDQYCPGDASTQMLIAIVSRLLCRLGLARSGTAIGLGSPIAGYWALDEQGWVLVAPQGVRLPLTTGERAFVGVLFNATGLRASHGELQDAVARSYTARHERHGTLGVLLTRLRRKLALQGLPLPIKSIHKWGYMFAGAVNIPNEIGDSVGKS